MAVFHNALTMMACAEAPPLVLATVLTRLTDERLEVRNMAATVLASLLHIKFVQDPQAVMVRKYLLITTSAVVNTMIKSPVVMMIACGRKNFYAEG